MKKLTAIILASFCLLNLSACFPVDTGYGNTVAYAGWSDDPSISEGALNKDALTGEHLPIFKIDTLEDLESFKSKYGAVFSMDSGYDEALSFNAALEKAQWDRDGFFEDNSLLIVYVPANSGSYRFGVQSVGVLKSSLCVYVEQKNDPENVTDDMAGWFVLIEIADKEIAGYTSFDAILASK